MTQGEKAKAYNDNYKTYIELINRLEEVKYAIKKQNYGIAMDILYNPYPKFQIISSIEIKENEDEQKSAKWDLADERATSLIKDAINGMKLTDEARFIVSNWLKSLRLQKWRPTEEQISCLFDAIVSYRQRGYKAETLDLLYKQLKQLCEL